MLGVHLSQRNEIENAKQWLPEFSLFKNEINCMKGRRPLEDHDDVNGNGAVSATSDHNMTKRA